MTLEEAQEHIRNAMREAAEAYVDAAIAQADSRETQFGIEFAARQLMEHQAAMNCLYVSGTFKGIVARKWKEDTLCG